MAQYVRENKPGAIIIGSHVKKTTEQLEYLLQEPGTVGISVDATRLLNNSADERAALLTQIIEVVGAAHSNGKTSVIYTNRQELIFNRIEIRLHFGAAVSAILVDIVRGLPDDIGFLITKGGITSNDVLRSGFAITTTRLLGKFNPVVQWCNYQQTITSFQTCQ